MSFEIWIIVGVVVTLIFIAWLSTPKLKDFVKILFGEAILVLFILISIYASS
jgi:hypothetical protein